MDCTCKTYLPFRIVAELWKKAENKNKFWPLAEFEFRRNKCLLGQFILSKRDVQEIKDKLKNSETRIIYVDYNEEKRVYSFWLEGLLLLRLEGKSVDKSVFKNLKPNWDFKILNRQWQKNC